LDNIALALYFVTGYVITYLGLEIAWHFAACGLQDKRIKPCLFKQVKMVMTAERRYTDREWMRNRSRRGKQGW
jgi:hypothetical protein